MNATREAALKPTKRRYRDVFVPEQNLTYRLRSITERERQHYRSLCDDDAEVNKLELIAYTCVDAAGDLLFSREDIGRLAELDSSITTRLYAEALEHCTFETGDELGNSPRIPSDSSP